ncbi:MAG: hypothetical protein GX977_06895 [Firmicutes bacterium]|nr:hypothetical protein [Bacillota bacterium]
MNAKERVTLAMARQIPDRVPVFPVITAYHASRVLGINYREIVLDPLLTYDVLLAAWRKYRFDGFEIGLGPEVGYKDHIIVRTIDGVDYLVDSVSGELYARLEDDEAPIPLHNDPPVKEPADLERITVPTVEELRAEGRLAPVERVLAEVGDDAYIAGTAASQSMNFLVYARGAEQAMLDLIRNPNLVHRIMQKGTDISINIGLALIEAGVDGIYIGDAWASASIISPAHYREFCLPYHRQAADAFHRHGAQVYLHVCGNVVPILELMADTGVDAIEPLDPLGGVTVGEAKRRVGRRVALKGGLDTILLLRGAPEEVVEAARECIDAGAADGGYLLGSGDDIPRDAPMENVAAMVEAAHAYGWY